MAGPPGANEFVTNADAGLNGFNGCASVDADDVGLAEVQGLVVHGWLEQVQSYSMLRAFLGEVSVLSKCGIATKFKSDTEKRLICHEVCIILPLLLDVAFGSLWRAFAGSL